MIDLPDHDPVTVTVEMIFPDQANHYGTLFGGNGLSLMAKAAFVAASRRARGPVVLASATRGNFPAPVQVGALLELSARVTRIGRASLSVAVEGVAEEIATGQRRAVLSGAFEMVAVDAAGRPRPLAAENFRKEETA
jgi:acyl-CoA hydrolase